MVVPKIRKIFWVQFNKMPGRYPNDPNFDLNVGGNGALIGYIYEKSGVNTHGEIYGCKFKKNKQYQVDKKENK